MKSKLLVSILFLFIFDLSAQNYIPYYNLINEAEFQIFNKDYKKALSLIDKAFKLEEPLAKDFYLKAMCLDKLKTVKHTKIKVEECLRNSALYNGRPSYWLTKNILGLQLDTNFIFELKTIENNQKLKNKALYYDIEYFIDKDQLYRKVLADSIMAYYTEDDIEYINYSKLVNKQDSINQKEFLNYIKEFNYPGIKKCGTNLASIILLHLNCTFLEDYNVILLEQLKKGFIQPLYYAQMMDRINCACNNKSFYYAYSIGKAEKKDCLPISKKQIIINRKSIGLSPYFSGTGLLQKDITKWKSIAYPLE